ncbi:hypothetical protein M8494_02585 [Serratia ureilytica]
MLLPLLALTVWRSSWGRGWWRCSVSRCISGWGIIRPAQCAGGGRGDGLRAGADHLLVGGGCAVQRAGHLSRLWRWAPQWQTVIRWCCLPPALAFSPR